MLYKAFAFSAMLAGARSCCSVVVGRGVLEAFFSYTICRIACLAEEYFLLLQPSIE